MQDVARIMDAPPRFKHLNHVIYQQDSGDKKVYRITNTFADGSVELNAWIVGTPAIVVNFTATHKFKALKAPVFLHNDIALRKMDEGRHMIVQIVDWDGEQQYQVKTHVDQENSVACPGTDLLPLKLPHTPTLVHLEDYIDEDFVQV